MKRSRFLSPLLAIALIPLCLGGCDPNMLGTVLPGPTATPGGSFDTATLIALDAGGNASLGGVITGTAVDVYDLGPCAAGDRIRVTVQATAGSLLDPVAALFDGDRSLMTLNDDVDLGAGRLESVLDYIVRAATAHCYLAVTRSSFATESGAYEGTVNVQRGQPVPTPPTQAMYLHFTGGPVTIPNIGTFNLSPFDAADINAAYNGLTPQIRSGIVATIRDSFAGTGLVITTTDEGPPPAGPHTTLYFGGFSRTAFGMSEDVDHENKNCCDDGIVFTDEFSDPFAQRPTPTGIARAVGNVGAHEGGHLLGLEHVADITALMDTTGTASTLLADQIFKRSALDNSVFPIGQQDAPLLLHRVIPQ